VAKYKRCPQCNVELKAGVPVCYVCGTVQPGFEGAGAEDLAEYEARVTEQELKHNPPNAAMVWIILGWCVVFLLIAIILVFNQSLTGPGGPR